jgi:hypothetical protein
MNSNHVVQTLDIEEEGAGKILVAAATNFYNLLSSFENPFEQKWSG